MTILKKINIMFRFSFVSALLIALFWTAWYVVNGAVSEGSPIILASGQHVISLSRWWDIIIGPIYSVILVSLFTSEKISTGENYSAGLSFVCVAGLVAGSLGFAMSHNPAVSLGFAIVASRVISLIKETISNDLADAFTIGSAVSAGLIPGLIFGLEQALVPVLAIGLIVGAGVLVHHFSFAVCLVFLLVFLLGSDFDAFTFSVSIALLATVGVGSIIGLGYGINEFCPLPPNCLIRKIWQGVVCWLLAIKKA